MRSRTSFQKRQKEIARMEKQREKAARRMQRKLEPKAPEELDTPLADADLAEAQPADLADATVESQVESR